MKQNLTTAAVVKKSKLDFFLPITIYFSHRYLVTPEDYSC